MKLKNLTSSAPCFPDLTYYDSMVAPGTLLLRTGSFMAAWLYRGPDMASKSVDEMAGLSRQINRVLMLGAGWMVQCDAIRSHAQDYPAVGCPPDPVTAMIDEERRQDFLAAGAHFESDYYFTVTYEPPAAAEEKAKSWMFSGGEDEGPASRSLREFTDKVAGIEDDLRSAFGHVRRLGYDPVTGFDDLLRYVHRCVVGIDHPIMLPEFPVGLQDIVACADFVGGNDPMIDGRHLRVVAIDGFPLQSVPGILHVLDTLAVEYRWSTRAILLDSEEALPRIEKVSKDWGFKIHGKAGDKMGTPAGPPNMDAAAMYADAMGNPKADPPEIGAYGEAASGWVQFLQYSSKIVLIEEDLNRMRDSVAQVQKVIRSHGFSARKETVNCVEAYLGSLPGDGHRDVRRSMLHTMNLADMLPATSIWTGPVVCPSPLMPPNSPPLLYATTTGGAPFRFDPHVQDVGHTMVVGPSGSGKSTFLSLKVAQWLARYRNARVIVFDKDHSMFALTMAAGGQFYDPAKLAANGMALQPLAHLETPSDRAWACEYLETLCILQKIKVFGPKERNLLADAVELLRSADRRDMTGLVTNVQDPEIKEALRPYTEGHELGSLIDGHSEQIEDGRFVTFELSGLMQLGERAVSAVLPYLFRRVARQLENGNGEPTLIILDEAWLYLQHKIFEQMMAEWLRVMRKKNCAVVIATPGLHEIFNSPIGSVILDACKTKMLMPNTEAANPETRKLYKMLGLSDRECELIAGAKAKGDVYVVSPDGRRMINVRVGQIGLCFCGSNSSEDRASINKLISLYGEAWPPHWLRMRGLVDAADRLEMEMGCEFLVSALQ